MLSRGWTLACALLLAVTAAVPTVMTQDDSTDDLEFYKVKLIGVSTFYGSENWKIDPTLYGGDPVGGLGNGTGQYDGSVGHRVTLRVELTDEEGNPVPTTDPLELPFVHMTAYINTPRGRLNGFVARDSPQSPVFNIHFDTDGTKEPAGGPAPGDALPALSQGVQYVNVDLRKGAIRATAVDAGSAELVFDYTNPAVEIQIPQLGTGGYVSQVPDSMFRLFNDIGWGDTIRMVTQPVRTTMNVTATYYFGQPGATVKWYALAAERGCQPPSCVFDGPGTIEIHQKELRKGLTDGTGMVTFSAPASELIDFSTKSYDAAVVVVAARLDPSEDLPAALPQEFEQGSARIRTGATEFVVPVSDASVRINAFRINTTVSDQAQQGGAPDPVRDAALAANALDVGFYDSGSAGGTSTSGDAVAFVPDAPGSDILVRSDILVDPSGLPADEGYRVARLPVLPIQEAHVTWYRVMGLLYGPGQNDFYALAFADRGYRVSISSPVAYVGERGTVFLNLTSVTTNYDLRQNEAGFDLRVLLRVNVPDLQINQTETFLLKEGMFENRPFAITSDRPADIRVDVIGTTGDTVSDTMSVNARFIEPPPKKNFVDRIPGFETVALLAVLGALAWRVQHKRE